MIKKIIKCCEKIKRLYEYVLVVMIVIVAAYYINTVRNIIRDAFACIDQFGKTYGFIVTDYIKDIYMLIESYIIQMVIIEIALQVISFLIKKAYEKICLGEKNKGAFAESLLDYLNNDKHNRCFLLTGSWGTGKTHALNEFFEKYYSNSNKRYYSISCYGLDERKKVADEIANMIKKGDNTIRRNLIDLVALVPVVGDVIKIVFEKSYDYRSLKEGTIIIFDDFERISPDTINYSKLIRGEKSYFSVFTKASVTDEAIRDINDEVNNLNKILSEKHIYDIKKKYSEILGFINELIEVYGIKVIIVCDIDRINHDIYWDITRNKLNSRVYNLSSTQERRSQIVDNMIINLPKQYRNICEELRNFLSKYSSKLREIIRIEVFKNLRNYSTILDAFVSTAGLIEKENMTEEFLLSLLNSIIMVHYHFYLGISNECVIGKMTIGTNILYACSRYRTKVNPDVFVRIDSETGNGNDIKWVGRNLAARWVKNLYDENLDIVAQIDEWRQYAFFRR